MSEYPRIPLRLTWVFPHAPVFFVTFCTYRRRKLLASDGVAAAFVNFAMRGYSEHHIAVGRYVIMPDHVHLFVGGSPNFDLSRWVGALKQSLARQITRSASATPIWQRGFFDHLLRSDESYAQKWMYVRDNPVRAGLVEQPQDWPYSGEVITIARS